MARQNPDILPDILFERRGQDGDAVEFVTLNRPAKLNALTLEMCQSLDRKLAELEADSDVAAVVIRGAGTRAFCAGGDIRTVYEAALAGDPLTASFFWAEYRLNRRIYHFPKAYVALMDGITMGGGVGVSAHGSDRVVTERTLLAMPETGIGLFPDVGATHLLPRLPGRLGLYVGLTGYRMNAADCLYSEVATHCVASQSLADIEAALVEANWCGDPAEVEGALIEPFAVDPGEPPLARHREAIDRCFEGDSVEEIFDNLQEDGGGWARETLALLQTRSPSSLKITFRALREGADLDFDQAMVMEYRLSQSCVAANDFREGVRALLVDKDNKPAWRPDSLAAIDDAAVEAFFAQQGGRDLTFE